MIKWGTFKAQILSGLLKDPNEIKATDAQMLAWAGWACAEISQHTAEMTQFQFSCDGSTSTFVLPDDVLGDLTREGLVILNDGARLNYLAPFRMIPDTIRQYGNINQQGDISFSNEDIGDYSYWIWPESILNLGFAPKVSDKLLLYYFRVWESPIDDNSILKFPRWMEYPFAYLVAAEALMPESVNISRIRQWGTKPDTGAPEQNPVHKQAMFFLDQAQRLLNKVPFQQRSTFFTNGPRQDDDQ